LETTPWVRLACRPEAAPSIANGNETAIDQTLESAFTRWQSGGFDRPNDLDRIFERTRQIWRICEILEAL
jgi:hypothetical protein